jgi:hypothetical protein
MHLNQTEKLRCIKALAVQYRYFIPDYLVSAEHDSTRAKAQIESGDRLSYKTVSL